MRQTLGKPRILTSSVTFLLAIAFLMYILLLLAKPNTGQASLPVDQFGVQELYSTMTGGKEWFANWNSNPRTLTWGQDPQDAWVNAHGNATYFIDGAGRMIISGSTPRLYIHDPAKMQSWHNVEMTVYAKRVSDQGTAYAGIAGVARTNHGVTGSELIDLCDTRGIGARMRYDGHTDFEKETSHPNSVAINNKTQWATGLPYNQWIGYKYAVYDMPDGNVKLEEWLDTTDGLNGGNWQIINELVDNGTNFGKAGVSCKAGIDPALKLTNDDARAGSESGKPNIAVYWRSDNVNKNGLIYKKMSVREIDPYGTSTPPPPPPEPSPPPEPKADTTIPVVTIISPQDASSVSSLTVAAYATDNVAVTKMDVSVDGKVRKTVSANKITYRSTLQTGSHTITVRAYDAAGNVGQQSVTVYRPRTTSIWAWPLNLHQFSRSWLVGPEGFLQASH